MYAVVNILKPNLNISRIKTYSDNSFSSEFTGSLKKPKILYNSTSFFVNSIIILDTINNMKVF